MVFGCGTIGGYRSVSPILKKWDKTISVTVPVEEKPIWLVSGRKNFGVADKMKIIIFGNFFGLSGFSFREKKRSHGLQDFEVAFHHTVCKTLRCITPRFSSALRRIAPRFSSALRCIGPRFSRNRIRDHGFFLRLKTAVRIQKIFCDISEY